ncbi:MAG: hypothetical protein KBT76_05900 [Sulfitobacter litoralis]|nr:hypothetical protein [Sulfitobacter litoralis]MBQ0801254.1 hypothetical protein [Sulfitobacter litoralis]
MSRKNEVARNLLTQEPGRVESHAEAADIQTVAQRKPARHSGGTPYTVRTTDGGTFVIVVSGRVQWALNQLRKAGAAGCTPIHNPAPRWAAYIHSLREIGVEIETITEPHEGNFPGHHARYVLRSGVSLGRNGGAV